MDATTKVRNPEPEKRRQKWGRRSGSVNKITTHKKRNPSNPLPAQIRYTTPLSLSLSLSIYIYIYIHIKYYVVCREQIASVSDRERTEYVVNYESATGGAAARERRWWCPGAVQWLQADLDGGAWGDGVRVSGLSSASDASSGAHESPIQDRRHNDTASASFVSAAATTTRAGPRHRSDEDPGTVRSLQGHSQCLSWLS